MSSSQKNDVTLRNIVEEDASVLLELNNDPNIAKCVVGNPQKVTMKEQIEWMKNLSTETMTVRFMIEYNSKAVGTIIISNIDRAIQTGNVNIKLLHEYQGRGIGKKAVTLAVEYCFSNLGLFCLTAHILEDNYPSQALFEKVGFVKEGVLRSRIVKDGVRKNLVSYSLLCSEFK